MAAFLKIELTETLLNNPILYSSFDHMKNKYDDERRKFEVKYIMSIDDEAVRARMLKHFDCDPNLALVRKGQINNWKTVMMPEQSQRIENRFMEICQSCDELKTYWSKWHIF